jgi:hypothetical protein
MRARMTSTNGSNSCLRPGRGRRGSVAVPSRCGVYRHCRAQQGSKTSGVAASASTWDGRPRPRLTSPALSAAACGARAPPWSPVPGGSGAIGSVPRAQVPQNVWRTTSCCSGGRW